MKKSLLILSLILVISIIFCFNIKKSDNNNSKEKFAIYLIDKNINSEEMKKNMNDLQLEKFPIITDENIISYDWDNHIIKLSNKFDIPESIRGSRNRNCVVMIGDERIYIGVFHSPLSSMKLSTEFPVLRVYEEDSCNILAINNNGIDINDIRIHEFFRKEHKLKK
ncbi:hypothetical protein UT300018_27300 [Clostridium faecium]